MNIEDRRTLYYYGVEKNSLDSWSEWGWKKEEIFEEFPQLQFAVSQKEMADKYLNIMLIEIGENA